MRKTTIAVLVASLSASVACGGEEPPPPQPPPPPSAAPPPPPPPPASTSATPPPPPKPALSDLIPQTLKNILDAINAHDSTKFGASFTDDVTSDIYGMGHVTGKSGYTKQIQVWLDAVPDTKCANTRVFVKDNVVATEYVCAGTMSKDFTPMPGMTMKASNKPVGQTRLVVAWFNDDGLVKQTHEYFDGPGLMAQMKGDKMAPPVPAVPSGPTEMHAYKGAADDKNADWAKGAWNDAFNKNTMDSILSTHAADADVVMGLAGGRKLSGKDLKAFGNDFLKAIPQPKWTVVNAWGIDGYAIVERTIDGTLKGKLGPMPPTNKPFTLHIGEIVQLGADGKVTHGWNFGNMMEVAPPPPPKAAPAAAPAPAGKPAAPAPKKPK